MPGRSSLAKRRPRKPPKKLKGRRSQGGQASNSSRSTPRAKRKADQVAGHVSVVVNEGDATTHDPYLQRRHSFDAAALRHSAMVTAPDGSGDQRGDGIFGAGLDGTPASSSTLAMSPSYRRGRAGQSRSASQETPMAASGASLRQLRRVKSGDGADRRPLRRHKSSRTPNTLPNEWRTDESDGSALDDYIWNTQQQEDGLDIIEAMASMMRNVRFAGNEGPRTKRRKAGGLSPLDMKQFVSAQSAQDSSEQDSEPADDVAPRLRTQLNQTADSLIRTASHMRAACFEEDASLLNSSRITSWIEQLTQVADQLRASSMQIPKAALHFAAAIGPSQLDSDDSGDAADESGCETDGAVLSSHKMQSLAESLHSSVMDDDIEEVPPAVGASFQARLRRRRVASELERTRSQNRSSMMTRSQSAKEVDRSAGLQFDAAWNAISEFIESSQQDKLLFGQMLPWHRKRLHDLVSTFQAESRGQGRGRVRSVAVLRTASTCVPSLDAKEQARQRWNSFRTDHPALFEGFVRDSVAGPSVRLTWCGMVACMHGCTGGCRSHIPDLRFRLRLCHRLEASGSMTEPVAANVDPISSENVGHRLLRTMGWKPGTGLGANRQGRQDPVPAYFRMGRSGIGADAD